MDRLLDDADYRLIIDITTSLNAMTDADASSRYVCERTRHHLKIQRCHFSELDDGPALLPADLVRGKILVVREGNARVTVPLRRDDDVHGFFTVEDDKARDWSNRELALITMIAERAWLVVEHQRLVSQLKRSETRHRKVLESAQEGVWETDATFRTTYVNARFAEMLGYTPDEMLGLPSGRFHHLAAERVKEIRDERRRGVSGTVDVEFRRREGDAMWLRVSSSPILDTDGEFTGTISFATDISDRVEQEDNLRAFNELLEINVKKRTAELESAQRAAETSLREKEILLKEIHHRVKNNLQIVSSMLYLQSRSVTDVVARAQLDASQARVRSISLVHEQLYRAPDLSRVDFGAYVRSVVHGLIDTFEATMRRIEVLVNIDAIGLEADRAIPAGLVITELVTNAFKHAFVGRSEGFVTVAMTEHGRDLELSVEDTGVGMAGDARAAQTTLGFELIDTFVAQLRGTLTITPGSHGGTRFAVRFPQPSRTGPTTRSDA